MTTFTLSKNFDVMDIIFQSANTIAFLSWLLLILFPTKKWTIPGLKYGVIVLLSMTYIFIVLPTLSEFQPDSFTTLQNVKALFLQDQMVVAGWIHYLVFDMFVGLFIVKDALQNGISRWKYSLCLPFTFMFGPLGLMMYYTVKLLKYMSDKRNK